MYTILSFILSGGKGTKISTVISVILLTLAVAFIGYQKFEIHQINKKIQYQDQLIATLTKNNDTLKRNQNTLVDTNQSNYDAAKKLDEERTTAKAAVASLSAKNVKSKEALDILRKTVVALSKDPKNDGPVAEVLKQTIRQIQNQRDMK